MRLWFLALLALLLPHSASATWKMAETASFRLYSKGSEAQLRADAARLEAYRTLLIELTGSRPPADAPRLDVFKVRKLADATPWSPMSDSIAGYYRADSGRITVVATEGPGSGPERIASQQVLQHEYAHHFMLGTSRVAYPAWYVEGFAEFVSTAELKPGSIDIGRASPNRVAWLRKQPWIPLERLLQLNPSASLTRDTGMFYAQSWLLTHYLHRTPGMQPRLRAYLDAVAGGADPVAAFRQIIDPDLDGLAHRLRRYLSSDATFSRTRGPLQPDVAVKVTRLAPSADAMLMRLVALEHGVPAAAGPRALADVRQQWAQLRPDPLATRALALAELELGSPARAAQLLDGLLASTPADPDLLRWRASALQPLASSASPAQLADARRLLVRANAASPNDWRILHAYARLYRPTDGPLPPRVLAILQRAFVLAPQVDSIVLDLSVALVHAGRLPEAAAVLRPLAWSPHDGTAVAIASRLLAKAQAGDRAGVLQEVAAVRARQGSGTVLKAMASPPG